MALEENNQKTVLVTGGAGFIGSHLCKRLLNDGFKVVCMDNLFTGTLKNISEFESELDELGLIDTVSDFGNYNPEFKINSVIEQIPKANSKVKKGRKIYLTLNASDFEMVEIPELTSITLRQAKKTIESLGFVVGDTVYVNDIARDEVISISHEGIDLKEGDFLKRTSVIDLKLGNGKQ